MKDLIKRYKTQNSKGIKGIKKLISESLTMFKWKLKTLIYETNKF